MQLEGRKIIVTGAASGIGAAIATLFAEHGAALALLDRASWPAEGAISENKGSRRASHQLPRHFTCDVTDQAAVKTQIAAAAQALGGLDGVINAAGADMVEPFAQMSLSQWEHIMRVNLTAPMLVCQSALAHFTGSGAIVNIASGAAHQPLRNRTAYCAAKAGLVMFTKALALEYAARDIRANVLSPGVIDTPMLRASYETAPDPEAALREISARPALGRIGSSDDIARGALYLMAAENSFVTGTTLVVDGGRVFH